MEETPKGTSEEQQRQDNAAQPPPPPPTTKEGNEGGLQHPEEYQQKPEVQQPPPGNPSRFRSLLGFFTKSEWAMVGLTAVIVILTAVLAGTGVVGIILVIQGGQDTVRIRNAAEQQANAASDQADAAQQFSDTAEDINGRMSDAVDQLSAAAENTKRTIGNAEKSFRAEQRAWVGVAATADVKGFTETEPWQVTVVFFNSGRTAARNVQSSGMFIASPVPISGPTDDQVGKLVFRPTQSIAPQGNYRESMGREFAGAVTTDREKSGEQMLLDRYNLVKSKQLFLYYFGLLKYDDVFRKPHETQFCIYLSNPDTKEVGMCDGFNDLN